MLTNCDAQQSTNLDVYGSTGSESPYPWSASVEGDEIFCQQNCQTNLCFSPCGLSLLFWYFINTTHHLDTGDLRGKYHTTSGLQFDWFGFRSLTSCK